MRIVIFFGVIIIVLVAAFIFLMRERGEDPAHIAYCEDLRSQYVDEETGDFSLTYPERVRMVWEGCI